MLDEADVLRELLEEGEAYYSPEQKQALQGAIEYFEDERSHCGRDRRSSAG